MDTNDKMDGEHDEKLKEALREAKDLRESFMESFNDLASEFESDFDDLKKRESEYAERIGEIVLSWYYNGGAVELNETDDIESDTPQTNQADQTDRSARKVGKIDRDRLERSMKNTEPPADLTKVFGRFEDILDTLGPPREDLDSIDAASKEVDGIASARDQESLLSVLPDRVLHPFISLLAARCRQFQSQTSDETRRMCDPDKVIHHAFPQLTAFVGERKPGYVHGLCKAHEPKGKSWKEDADHWWSVLSDRIPEDDHEENLNVERALDRIDETMQDSKQAAADLIGKLLEEGLPADDPRVVSRADALYDSLEGSEFKSLRRAVRDFRAGDEEETEDRRLDDWKYIDRTEGAIAVVIGGEPREHARKRLKESFAFEDLEWIPSDRIRCIQGLGDRVAAGTIDFVIQLCSISGHNVDDNVRSECLDKNVPFAAVHGGYGVNNVKQEIETAIEAVS